MARKPLPKFQASFNRVYGRYKRRAEKNDIAFTLSPGLFKYLCERDCVYCSSPPDSNDKFAEESLNGSWKYNTLDRVDSSLGYVEGNVQPCCTLCNRLKSNLEESEFLQHITRIVRVLELKGIKED